MQEIEQTMTWREIVEWGVFDKYMALEREKAKNKAAHEQWLERARKGMY